MRKVRERIGSQEAKYVCRGQAPSITIFERELYRNTADRTNLLVNDEVGVFLKNGPLYTRRLRLPTLFFGA